MFVIIGTVTADLFITSPTPPRTPGGDGFRHSNLVFTDTPLTIGMGGNGGNSAYVLAGLGAATALCGAVGRDLLGNTLVNWLAKQQIDLAGLWQDKTAVTSTSTIIMTAADSQTVFHHRGASTTADFSQMPRHLFDQAKALLATSFPLLPRLRTGGFAQALATVQQHGGLTALDIGPAIGEPATLAELAPLLPLVDYLLANTHELCALTGAANWPQAAAQVLAAGAKRLVIKQGAVGASIWTATEKLFVPAFSVAAKMSVGAGDAFNAGLLYGLVDKRPLTAALQFAHAVAALVVSSQHGVLDSPTLTEVEAFLTA